MQCAESKKRILYKQVSLKPGNFVRNCPHSRNVILLNPCFWVCWFFFCLVYHQHFHPRWQYKIDKHLKYRQFLIEHWLPHIAFSNLATVSFERLIIAVAWLMTSNRITVIWSDWFCYWPLERFDSMGFFFKFYYFLYAHALSIKLLHFRIYRVTVIYFSLSIRNVRWIQLEKKQLNEWFFNIRDSLLVCMIHGSG